jgi:hypothetical protein
MYDVGMIRHVFVRMITNLNELKLTTTIGYAVKGLIPKQADCSRQISAPIAPVSVVDPFLLVGLEPEDRQFVILFSLINRKQ